MSRRIDWRRLTGCLLAASIAMALASASLSGWGPTLSHARGEATSRPAHASPSSGHPKPQVAEGYFPNVVLTTHEKRTVRFYDDLVKGKVVLINFLFTACTTLCPVTTANLIKVQDALSERVGREIFFYSITLDPERDTPEVLTRYAEHFKVKPGWTFLTGRPDEITMLRRRLGAYDPNPAIDADKTQHLALIIYGNERTGKWRTIPGLDKPERIVRAVLRVVGR